MKKKNQRAFWFIPLRYVILLALVLCLPLIYLVLTPLTVYSVAYLLKLLYSVSIHNEFIAINSNFIIQIIPSCVAGSAYLLLLILNMLTPMKPRQRIYSILISLVLLFLLNVFRIFLLSVLYVNNFSYFDLTHKIFWYFLSTVFVVLIWFLTVKFFRIESIPFYSDAKFFYREMVKK